MSINIISGFWQCDCCNSTQVS